MKPELPQDALHIIQRLNQNGCEAYVVGGCVRDFCLHQTPHDWDITTNASPARVMQVFDGCHIEETGLQHGTVSIILNHTPYEITTYRIDGEYTDSRHPDRVTFSSSLKEDLARRDFTMNALAYHPDEGIVDYYGGREDIRAGIVRCVGNAHRRFDEDALRILRAMRFASVLGFSIDAETKRAILDTKDKLDFVAAERKTTELLKLLCGQSVRRILTEYHSVLDTFLPGFSRTAQTEQHNPYHIYPVLGHTAAAVEAVPAVPVLRLAMLFHDIGKPACHTLDEKGISHFYGHPQKSVEIAEGIFSHALKLDNATARQVLTLVQYHDTPIPRHKKSVLKWLNRLGESTLRQLIQVKRADILAQNPEYLHRLSELEELSGILDRVIAEESCFSLKQLSVSGNDLIALGIPAGKYIGQVLRALLEQVMDGMPNEKDILICKAQQLWAKLQKSGCVD